MPSHSPSALSSSLPHFYIYLSVGCTTPTHLTPHTTRSHSKKKENITSTPFANTPSSLFSRNHRAVAASFQASLSSTLTLLCLPPHPPPPPHPPTYLFLVIQCTSLTCAATSTTLRLPNQLYLLGQYCYLISLPPLLPSFQSHLHTASQRDCHGLKVLWILDIIHFFMRRERVWQNGRREWEDERQNIRGGGKGQKEKRG